VDKHTSRTFLETFIREINVSVETADEALSDATVSHTEMNMAKVHLIEARMWCEECLKLEPEENEESEDDKEKSILGSAGDQHPISAAV